MVEVIMPPTSGAAIGFMTSELMPLSHKIGNETRQHHAYGHKFRPEAVHGAFDDGLLDVFVLQRFSAREATVQRFVEVTRP